MSQGLIDGLLLLAAGGLGGFLVAWGGFRNQQKTHSTRLDAQDKRIDNLWAEHNKDHDKLWKLDGDSREIRAVVRERTQKTHRHHGEREFDVTIEDSGVSPLPAPPEPKK